MAARAAHHKFLHPANDGAALPVLHLNGYNIANPTLLARIPERELVALMEGYGYRLILVTGGFDGEDPRPCTNASRPASTRPSTASPRRRAARAASGR